MITFVDIILCHLRSPAGFGWYLTIEKARDVGIVALRLSRHDLLTAMQQELLAASHDLELRSDVDMTFQGQNSYICLNAF